MVRKVTELFDNPEHDDYLDEDAEYIQEQGKKFVILNDPEEEEFEEDEIDTEEEEEEEE